MASERTNEYDDLPGNAIPQASMKLSPPRRKSALTPRGLPALVDCTTGVIVYSHVDKNVGDIVLHG